MPVRARNDRPEYNARLDPEDSRLEEWLIRLIDIGRFANQTLPEAVVEFVEQVTGDVGYRGEAFYEIVANTSDKKPPETALAPLPPTGIMRRGGSYHQLIPEADRSQGEPASIAIPADLIWHVAVPPELGTPEKHRAMLAALARQELMPSFVLESERLGADVGYEFVAHRRASEIAVERVTRAWGTIPSLRQVSGTTEYYFVARTLQFHRSQALLREHIISGLNLLLERLDVPSQLVLEGLPSVASITNLMAGLDKGEIGFTAALDAAQL